MSQVETAYSIYLKVATIHLKIADIVKEMNTCSTEEARYRVLLALLTELENELSDVCEVKYHEA